MRKFGLFLLLFMLLPLAVYAHGEGIEHYLDELEGEPCPDSDFTCVTLTVPLDHANPDDDTMEVVFGVLPASGESKGIFVTVVGGPGGSGLAVADYYSSFFDPSIFENFDIVFFDQRGIAASGGLDCPEASAAYYLDTARPTTPEGEAGVIDAARTYAESCQAEMDAEEWLPYLGTEQAIQDLEAFRQAVGAPPMWLYGESYGTQFSQEYATAYPDAIAGLILDGVVDLSLTGTEYYLGQTQAFSDALAASFAACADDAACTADLPDAAELYSDLVSELLTAPITVPFPLPSGESEPRQYTIAMLELSAIGATYSRDARSYFLRALAAAGRGDLQPLLRLAYQDAGVDPVTLEAIADPSYSNGMYYGVECNDYSFGAGTPDENAAAFLESGADLQREVDYLGNIFYTDLPCVFWNVEGRAERPAPFVGGDYVTFILNSDIDPATPISNGYSVFDNLDNAYMITDTGGPHVIFGRDLTCPDVAITAWMIDDVLPAAHEFTCAGSAIAGYVPLSPASISDFSDGVAFLDAVDREIFNLPEYAYWDASDTLAFGCPYGGAVTVEPTDDGEAFTFDGCALFNGAVLDGTGEWIYDVTITFELTLTGDADGEMVYIYDEALGGASYSGTFNGEIINPRV